MLIRQLVAAGTLIATIISTMLIGIFALDRATAQAAPPGTIGTLTLTPATGFDITAPAVRTSAGCAADSNGYNVVVTGPGPFADGFFIVGTTSANFSTTDPIDSAFSLNMRDAAAQLGTTIVAAEYVVTFNCVDDFIGDVKGTFVGSMYFTSPTAYQTTDPNGPPTSTTSATTTASTTTASTTATSTTATTTATSTTATPTTVTSTTPPTSSQTTTTTPGSGCELGQIGCVGPDPDGSSTTTSPTNIAGINPPPNSGGGTQTIGMTTGLLGQTGGPVGFIFIGGLILVAVGLALIIAVGRLRKGLE